MRSMKASEFKARCLALMDEVNETGEVIVITKNGRAVAELHPHRHARKDVPFGLHPGVDYGDDLVGASFDSEWESLVNDPQQGLGPQ